MSTIVAIITGGELPAYACVAEYLVGARIIAADAGYQQLRKQWGDELCRPELIVGDCDSLRVEDIAYAEQQGIAIARYPRDKALSDTELAFEWARQWGATEIRLIGGTGGRLDHTLSNLVYLSRVEELSLWLTSAGVAYFIDDERRRELILEIALDRDISVIPLYAQYSGASHSDASRCSSDAIAGQQELTHDATEGIEKAPHKLSSEGLLWPLDDLDWSRALSLSNRSSAERVRLRVHSGRFLCYVVHEA